MVREGILVVISGFAGTGKGTVVKKLVESYDNYALSVSMTTRNPRPGEVEGKSYFFVDKETFEKKIQEDGFIEHACYCENYYGTPRAYVEQQMQEGKDVILEIEIQGALQIKKMFPNALLLFMMAPSAKVLHERLVGRGTETPEVVAKRMKRASEEAAGIENYDFILINDEVDKCVQQARNVIESAHLTPGRNIKFIEKTREDLQGISKGE
ncbi:MAG: guanylate kinase [Lachnospiraceae bacterium]|nr:guanylate kinase [Lachnospiraceae bacterium]